MFINIINNYGARLTSLCYRVQHSGLISHHYVQSREYRDQLPILPLEQPQLRLSCQVSGRVQGEHLAGQEKGLLWKAKEVQRCQLAMGIPALIYRAEDLFGPHPLSGLCIVHGTQAVGCQEGEEQSSQARLIQRDQS